jgi:hypothetical protein
VLRDRECDDDDDVTRWRLAGAGILDSDVSAWACSTLITSLLYLWK